MPSARVNGVSLFYEESGSGPPLLLIHAFPVGRGMWEPQVPFFGAHYRVVTYDCRGFGRSEAPTAPGAYSLPLSVGDARGLLAHVGALPAVVWGLSMGGSIALNLALTHPTSVRALVLCATGAGSEDPGAFRARCVEYGEASSRGMDGFFERMMDWPVFADFVKGPRESRVLREMVMAQPPHGIGLTALYTMAPRPPVYALEERLAGIRVPTLVVCGERDEACVESSRFLARAIPGARLWMMKGAGHFLNLEEPQLVNETVLAFLREHGVDQR
jgi:proline iminopeptidase